MKVKRTSFYIFFLDKQTYVVWTRLFLIWQLHHAKMKHLPEHLGKTGY
jgi:hypothetical protein